MTDAPKLPPFPEKPESLSANCDCDLCRGWHFNYYRDLAAAWESRARHYAHALTGIYCGACGDNDPNIVEDALAYQDIETIAHDALRDGGPLPAKEG